MIAWFEKVLVGLTLLTGLIWLIDIACSSPSAAPSAPACWTRRNPSSSTIPAPSSRCWPWCW
jgi:hypothetical protein